MSTTRPHPHAVAAVVRRIYAAAAELERMFPGRHFTPDGHMVGSIGEVMAAADFGLSLLKASAQTHDALTLDGRHVQIKATQTDRVALTSEPQDLLVLTLAQDGTASVVYNGPGAPVWAAAGKLQKNGQRQIAVTKLRSLNMLVRDRDRIRRAT